MKIINSLKYSLFIAICAMAFAACEKSNEVAIPAEVATFTGQNGASYFILDATTTFQIPVSFTTTSSEDRDVEIVVTSPTGAVQGQQYTLSSTSLTIPAGQSIAYITVTGEYDEYITGRKDSIIFTIQDPSNSPRAEGFNNVFRLFMRGPCFDGDIDDNVLAEMVGTYSTSNDAGFGDYGPYTTTINSITRLSPTTARAIINNVWDYGFGNVPFIMDWTDPDNITINVEQPTTTPADASALNSAYAGMQLVIRAHANGESGSFSVCNGTLRLVYQLGVSNGGTILGYFPNVGVTTMAR